MGMDTRPSDLTLSNVVFYVGFSVCVCFYLFLILPIPGEYLGDSQEYLHLGAALRNLTFSYNYMRGLLYPAFIAITWNRIGIADSTYLAQIILFLVALYVFCRSTLGSDLFALPVLLVAISPAIAYLQKLAYADVLRYIVEKGSIAVDGVSLTVTEVDDRSFTVSLIPETLQRTNLGAVDTGRRVNLEVDVLAKYVEKLMVTAS